jgi:ribosomal protein L40E
MEKLRLRCPSCSKLYEVSADDIKSHSPQFDCVVCFSRFGVEMPSLKTFIVAKSAEGERVRTFQEELRTQSLAALQAEIQRGNDKNQDKACPKCGALNAKNSEECYSCHVIFERLEQLPLDPRLRAQPSLVRKWKNLVLNFDNKDLHEDFLKSCHQVEALRFAILKYEELRRAQGGADDVCTTMIARAQSLLHVPAAAASATPTGAGAVNGVIKSEAPQAWEKWCLWVPVGLSLVMILVGFLNLSLRNLVGAGVAVLLLTLGLIYFWKGRLSLSDFHR